MRARALVGAALAAVIAGGAAAPAAGEAGDPIGFGVSVRLIAPLGKPLRVGVTLDAEAGALDPRTAPLRLRVRVAYRCGGTFAGTSGQTAIDQALVSPPAPGAAYHSQSAGRVRPHRFGYLTVCAFLEQEGDARQFATDTDSIVVITHRCTYVVRRRDGAVRRLAAARRALGHAHGAHRAVVARRVARRRAAAILARRAVARGCKPPNA